MTKLSDDQKPEPDDLLLQQLAEKKDDESLLTEDDKAKAVKRPASSFTGLRRGQIEGNMQNELALKCQIQKRFSELSIWAWLFKTF